jgi:8-oxo-dGTP pyrophosphatase MutT (NUDIX family)
MNIWGQAWKSYIPPGRRVYGCICVSATNKVLLVQGRQGEKKWSFPKGHREVYDCTPLDCALRELKEETGLTLDNSYVGSKRFRAGEYFIYLLPAEFQAKPEDTREIQTAKWFTVEELAKLNKNVDVSMFANYVQKSFAEPCSETPEVEEAKDSVPTCA